MVRKTQLLTLMVLGGLFGVGVCVFGLTAPYANSAAVPPQAGITQQRSLTSGSTMAKSSTQQESEMATEPFALIELFTSEGCSSCPSADQNLERIAAQAETSGQNVYTLSYHVDYWDYLGWKDPYSAKQYSDRQRSYARQFKSSRIYTPQMVVNGNVEFVGSNQKNSNRALKQALQSKTQSSIAVDSYMNGGVVNAHWKARQLGKRDQVQVALVQNSGEQKVSRGENARRKLTHVNIVRQLETVANPAAEGWIKFSVPKGFASDEFHVVAFVQTPDAVSAAGKSTIRAKAAKKDAMTKSMK